MFGAGFSEGSASQPLSSTGSILRLDTGAGDETSSITTEGLSPSVMRQFEDSDDEDDDEEYFAMTPEDTSDCELQETQAATAAEPPRPSSTGTAASDALGSWTDVVDPMETSSAEPDEFVPQRRSLRPQLSQPSTPKVKGMQMEEEVASKTTDSDTTVPSMDHSAACTSVPASQSKTQVVIGDVAYATYRAVLYYVGPFNASTYLAC